MDAYNMPGKLIVGTAAEKAALTLANLEVGTWFHATDGGAGSTVFVVSYTAGAKAWVAVA